MIDYEKCTAILSKYDDLGRLRRNQNLSSNPLVREFLKMLAYIEYELVKFMEYEGNHLY